MGRLTPGSVGIDARSLQQGPAGVATYVSNLRDRIPCLDLFDAKRPRNNLLWNHLRVPPAQLVRNWRVYHAPAYTCALLNFCPVVLSVHDVSYLVKPEWYPYPVDPARRLFYRASMRAANRIIVPSDFSRDEVLKRFPELKNRVRRIYLGVSDFFSRDEELASEVRKTYNLPPRFILHVGDIHPRRNVEVVLEAGKVVDLKVVLVGRILGPSLPMAHRGCLFSNISMRHLKGLYSAATVFAYPSFYEGFGLPLVEAMSCGLPVVAARRSCIPEICGDGALLVDPDPDSLAAGIREVLGNADWWVDKGQRRARRFSWERTAAETQAVYQELV